MQQPFSKIRVVDFTHVIAGPFCTHQLAVLGADVIKIEPPQMPDMIRTDGPQSAETAQGLSPMFKAQNANKRALSLDLKTAPGKEIALTLLKTADVLVENYRSGALSALGLGDEAMRQHNPSLIYCSLTGFGQNGPKAQHTAYDNVIQAFSGLMDANGDPQTSPVKVGPPILDYGTGIQAAFAIAAALYQRTQTGKGQYIDIAMLDSAIMLMASHYSHYQASGELWPLTGNSSASKAGYGCYATQKGLLMIGAYTAKQHAAMWRVLGNPQRAQEVEKMTLAELGDQMQSDAKAITHALQTQTADDWEMALNEAKVPAARVRSLEETLAHPQLLSRSVFQKPPTGSEFPLPLASFQYASHGPRIHSPPPQHGEQTNEILRELGYDETQIASFREQGIV